MSRAIEQLATIHGELHAVILSYDKEGLAGGGRGYYLTVHPTIVNFDGSREESLTGWRVLPLGNAPRYSRTRLTRLYLDPATYAKAGISMADLMTVEQYIQSILTPDNAVELLEAELACARLSVFEASWDARKRVKYYLLGSGQEYNEAALVKDFEGELERLIEAIRSAKE